jgi:multidrug efflux pump subunit AcrB
MFASFFLSRTFVPMMCAKFLPEEHGAAGHGAHTPGFFGPLHQRIEGVINGLTLGYKWLLAGALRHRVAVLTVVGVLFVGALGLGTRLGREFFPQVDAGQITLYVRAPSNLRLDATERRVATVEQFLKENVPAAEREMVVSEIGINPDWSAAYTANSGQQDAVVRVQLNEHRTKSAQEYAIELRHRFHADPRFADLRVAFDTGGIVSAALNLGASSPIDVQVEGGSREEGRRLAREVRNRARAVRGVADARVLQRLDAPYLVISVNRAKAARVGLRPRDVINQVVAAMNSSISIDRNFWIDVKTGNQYFVAVQYPESPYTNLDDVLNVSATGTHQPYPVKLSSLAGVRRTTGAVEINHDSLERVYNVQLNTEGRDIAAVATDVQKALAGLHVPEGMHVSMRGEFERMNESTFDLAKGLVLAALLVYLLQVALFRSWVGPFIIMFTVPLGVIGVITLLYLTNTTLNVQSEMGVIFLVGIAVNNGVLLVDFANKQRKLGLSPRDAILVAAGIRFRPILMTFLATFLDLIPMAVGMGRGSEANVPLARAVVGGLLTSTCLTFFVVPILYSMLIRDRPDNEAAVEAELADLPEVRPALAAAGPVAAAGPGGEGVIAVSGPEGPSPTH